MQFKSVCRASASVRLMAAMTGCAANHPSTPPVQSELAAKSIEREQHKHPYLLIKPTILSEGNAGPSVGQVIRTR